MNFDQTYYNQVDLLLDVLPVLNQFDCFAVKGGTAINLFIQNMPRLSIDIDLTYLPIEPRETFLKNLSTEMARMSQAIRESALQVQLMPLSKLLVSSDKASIKIEPNLIIRGSAFDCEYYDLCKRAQNQFLKFSRIKTLSFSDLYGGKICASLARQHPRDLFDVKFLLDNHGLPDNVRQALIAYLLRSPKPIHELLNPKLNIDDFQNTYKKEFVGMCDALISSEELIEAFKMLIKLIISGLTKNERHFLLSIKSGEPNWSLMPIPGLDKLPAIQWKILNIRKMSKHKQAAALNRLRSVLEI